MKRRTALKMLSSLPLCSFVTLHSKEMEDVYSKIKPSDVLRFPIPSVVPGDEIDITVLSVVPVLSLPTGWLVYKNDQLKQPTPGNYRHFTEIYREIYYKTFSKNQSENFVSVKLKSKTKDVLVQVNKVTWKESKYRFLNCGTYCLNGKIVCPTYGL